MSDIDVAEPIAEKQSFQSLLEALQLSLDDDGTITDAQGEVIQPHQFAAMGILPTTEVAENPFSITCNDDAIKAMRIRFQWESDIAASKERVRSFTANEEKIQRHIGHKLAGWDYCRLPNLIAWAKVALAKNGKPFGRGKTFRCEGYGSLVFRDQPEREEIIDPAEAIAWARKWAPQIIKTEESVTMTAIVNAREELEKEHEMSVPTPFMKVIEAAESVPKVETGITSKKR